MTSTLVIFFFTLPSLTLETFLKMRETTLDLLADINMLLMIDNGIRDAINMVCHMFERTFPIHPIKKKMKQPVT